jgi:hypothetical protein
MASAMFSQTAIDGLPIKILTDHPIGQASEFILVIVQVVTVVKQQLRKLQQDFPQRIFILQLHKCPRATTILDWPASFPR